MSKESFVKSIETSLIYHFSRDQVTLISNIVTKTLSEYDLSERCTDLVTYDDGNEKIIRRFKACLMVDGKSEKTIAQYIRQIKKLSDALGNKPFEKMDTYDIRYFLAMELERGVSDRTREKTR